VSPVRQGFLAFIGLLVVGCALLAQSVASAPARSDAVDVPGGCPRRIASFVSTRAQLTKDAAAAAAAQVPRVFGRLTSMGHPAWRHSQLDALIFLSRVPLAFGHEPRVRGLERYVKIAGAACGRRTADASALVFLEFPDCQLPCAYQWAYITRLRRGWRLWTSYPV
jgi:hypothetical protein